MPRLVVDVVLFYGSLLLSLAAVVVFLWLMRDVRGPRGPQNGA